jgi:hypothetical protein
MDLMTAVTAVPSKRRVIFPAKFPRHRFPGRAAGDWFAALL